MARRWSAVLARLGVPTGDGRILAPGGITSRELPLPLLWQGQTEDGHGGSRVIGRIETVSFGDGMVTATGSMLDSEEWGTAIEQIEAGVVGPSVDLDDIEAVMDDADRMVIVRGRIAGATLVPIPAFEGVSIGLDPAPASTSQEGTYASYAAELMTFASTAQAQRASVVVRPPLEWFSQPDVDRLTPLTVSDTGRVFGHIAGWDTEHVGLPGVKPPRSRTGYANFHVASQTTRDGTVVPVGTLVTGPRHADPQLAFRAAAQHYDDLDCAVAKVVAGEDEFGIWVAGWMLPGADPVKVEQFMSTPVSGDWRRVGGALDLVAVCSVNVPGFPVPKARTVFSVSAGVKVEKTLIASFGITPQAGSFGVPRKRDEQDAELARAVWAWVSATTATEG